MVDGGNNNNWETKDPEGDDSGFILSTSHGTKTFELMVICDDGSGSCEQKLILKLNDLKNRL